jgi:hypothetical protein
LILFTLALSIVLRPRGHDMPPELSSLEVGGAEDVAGLLAPAPGVQAQAEPQTPRPAARLENRLETCLETYLEACFGACG